MSDNTQFIRKVSLILGNRDGKGIEYGMFRVRFTVNKADTQSPANADIYIYNLCAEDETTARKEFTHVFLEVGYEGNSGLIFSGQIRQARSGRENATDTYLNIIAQDGDKAYGFSVVNTTLPAGWSQTDLHGAAVKALAPYDITPGVVPTFGGPAMPRGRVCYAMTRDILGRLADASGSTWHFEDDLLHMLPLASAMPDEAQVVTAKTGMIGLPEQTLTGIAVRCLINPKIKFKGLIKLDNASVQGAKISVAYSAINYFPGLDADGLYKVYSITATGDTRGGQGSPWYFDLICVAKDGSAPLSGPFINAVASSTGF